MEKLLRVRDKKSGLSERLLMYRSADQLKNTLLLFFLIVLFAASPVCAGLNQWTTNGPYGTQITDMAISPDFTSDQTVFTTTPRGVYKSLNGGNSWTQVNTLSYPRTLAISPGYSSDLTIFAGAGTNIYKSIDGGVSWTSKSVPISISVSAISPNYRIDQTIFTGSLWGQGIAKSSDGGATWALKNTGLTNLSVYSLAFSPNFATDQTVFAGAMSGLYKSINGGDSWVKVYSISSDYPEALVLSPNYAVDQTIFVGFWNGGTFKSTNGGTSWTTVNVNKIASFAISPNFSNDKTIFAGSIRSGIYKSIDGGSTWTLVNNGLAISWVQAITISSDFTNDQTLFAGLGINSDGPGIYKTTNGGNLWTEANTGINVGRQTSSLALSPDYSNDRTIFAGTGDGGANDVYRSTDNGDTWTMMGNAKGSVVAISPNFIIDHTIFAGSWNSLNPVYKSIDGGNSWVQTGLGYQVSDIAVSPGYADDQTVFASGNFGVYKSTNRGVSWSAANSGLLSGYKDDIVFSPNFINDQTLFVGGFGGLFKSTNGGANWTNVSSGLPQTSGYSGPSIGSIVVSPNYASDQTLFTSVWGSGVFKSTNGGTTWVQVSVDTSNSPKLAISPNYSTDQTIFKAVGSGRIVYKSNNGGVTWSQVTMTGFPSSIYVSILYLAVSPNYATDNTILAGTHDGVYSYTSPPTCTDADQDGYAIEGGACGVVDCNDSSQLEHPNQAWYKDTDNDAYSSGDVIVQCTRPTGYKVASELTASSGDCNDGNASINPGATEVCNGVDDNCNSQTDEGVQNTYYRDADGDTYGNASVTTQACTAPSGYVSNSADCNDSNTSINPGATEVCNGMDDNCNGQVDEGVQNTYYRDADNDTYGNVSVTTQACTQPPGYVTNSSDCNDGNASINPGAAEVCNGIDDNCNSLTDEGVQNTYYQDADNDTYGNSSVTTQACTQPSGYVSNSSDCDDSNASIKPGVTEVCNGVDDDCNGQIDDGISNIVAGTDVGACQAEIQSCVNGTMTIVQAAIGPSAEVCDGVDNDCNGQTDEGIPNIVAGSDIGACQTEIQSCINGSMIVVRPEIGPSAEVCDGVDNDCNGQTDEGIPNIITGSDVGACQTEIQSCVNGAMAVVQPAIGPSVEVCDGVDNDCNGQVDEGVQNTYYRDADNDTYGNASVTTQACMPPAGYVSNNGDCNDVDPLINPKAMDAICDGVDNNCNGTPDDGYVSSNTTCGVGVCGATGQLVCVNGQTQDTCMAGQPQTEGPVGDPSCNDNMDNDCDGITDTSDSGCINTSTGQNVIVQPIDATTAMAPVDITFSNVTEGGITSLTTSGVGQPPPSGFRMGSPPVYYDISTTAAYNGPIQVCLSYNETQFAVERNLKLFHQESGAWVNITEPGYPDTTNNIICGTTTSLSPFAIFENSNRPPVASAGLDLQMECAGSACPVVLDGTSSTDPDSSPGTQDDIVLYRWYEGYGTAGQQLLGTGSQAVVTMSLGNHTITLEVADKSGAIGRDTVNIILDPAYLSMFVFEKAEVDWPKTAGALAEAKLHGKLALPVGLLLQELTATAKIRLDLAGVPGILSQTANLVVKGGEGEKWEFKANPSGAGIQDFFIHWKGAKFDYNSPVHMKTEFIALTQTALSIDREGTSDPISLTVNGVTASIDATGVVTTSVPYEIDEDGEVTLTLPFELTPEMKIMLTIGTQPPITISVKDYYTPGSGRFELKAKVNPGSLTGASRPATLGINLALGAEGFSGSVAVSEWNRLSTKEWKAELK